ncbi:MAG: hypothetical protein ACRD45_12055 [Bryobacteraceae bacterium]
MPTQRRDRQGAVQVPNTAGFVTPELCEQNPDREGGVRAIAGTGSFYA